MVDTSTLSQVASISAGFGVAMLVFRVQRHLEMQHGEEQGAWIAVADWLLVGATSISLLLVIFPLYP